MHPTMISVHFDDSNGSGRVGIGINLVRTVAGNVGAMRRLTYLLIFMAFGMFFSIFSNNISDYTIRFIHKTYKNTRFIKWKLAPARVFFQ